MNKLQTALKTDVEFSWIILLAPVVRNSGRLVFLALKLFFESYIKCKEINPIKIARYESYTDKVTHSG
jgi:hypothetical protein